MEAKVKALGRADLHMHTCVSDGLFTVQEVLDHVARRGHLDVIAITDHDRIDAALWAYEHCDDYPFDIIPGIEVTSAVGHVLGLWVTRVIPRRLSLAETVAAIHEQGGVAILAHPYHFHLSIVMRNFMRYTRRPEVLLEARLDAIEAHNAGVLMLGNNILAYRLAHKVGFAITGGSDAHTLGAIGSGQTRFPGRTAADLRQAIASARTAVEGKSWPLIDYWNFSRRSITNTLSGFLAANSPSNRRIQP